MAWAATRLARWRAPRRSPRSPRSTPNIQGRTWSTRWPTRSPAPTCGCRRLIISDPAVEGMGTTLTALLWSDGQAALCHIGDSRAYLLRDGQFYQITHDHTLVQSLVDEGKITEDDVATHPHRSLLLRALDGRTRRRPGPVHARNDGGRPLSAVLRRPVRRGDRADAAPDAQLRAGTRKRPRCSSSSSPSGAAARTTSPASWPTWWTRRTRCSRRPGIPVMAGAASQRHAAELRSPARQSSPAARASG